MDFVIVMRFPLNTLLYQNQWENLGYYKHLQFLLHGPWLGLTSIGIFKLAEVYLN